MQSQYMATSVLQMFLPYLLRHIYRLIIRFDYVFQCDMSLLRIQVQLVRFH
jgi:hypothetical protein